MLFMLDALNISFDVPRLLARFSLHTARRRAIREANTRADNMRVMQLNRSHSF